MGAIRPLLASIYVQVPSSVIDQGALSVRAEDRVHACALVSVDGEALGSGWILSGGKKLCQELFTAQSSAL